MVRSIHLYQDMVTTDQDVSTEEAIAGDMVDSM